MLRIKILFFLHWMRGPEGVPISVLCKFYCADLKSVLKVVGTLEADGLVDHWKSHRKVSITREGSEAALEIILRPQKGRSARKWISEVRSGRKELKGLAAIPRTLETFEHAEYDIEDMIDQLREAERHECD
jgi:hypothetical protein